MTGSIGRLLFLARSIFILLIVTIVGYGLYENSRQIAKLESRLNAIEGFSRYSRRKSISDSIAVQIVETAPEGLNDKPSFLGSTNIYYGRDFDYQSRKVLAEGKGIINGRVTTNGKGCAGLKFRLRLSGINSAWTTSGPDGIYTLRVPPGKYRYQGFEFDELTAHDLLSGMVEKRDGVRSGERPIEAGAEKPGRGPDFDFFTAIVPVSPIDYEKVSGNSVRLEWNEVPGARQYEIRLHEAAPGKRSFKSLSPREKPFQTKENFFQITDMSQLQKGKFYLWSVTAFDSEGREISRTPEFHRARTTFEIQ